MQTASGQTASGLTATGQPAPAKALAIPLQWRSRPWLWLVGALIVLVLVAALAFSIARRSAELPAASRSPASLKELPGRPEDIEVHGGPARSVLPPTEARARNAAVPFWSGALVAARPFVFSGSDVDRARAMLCLATAVLYEAGDDTTGQAAVAQVVLNRVRHPAFPGTVCGVVYQGAQRSTGCQFTFTCDGSLRRRMSDAAWQRARAVAERALQGHVDKSVGLSTHYHTDWVYPYWSPELRKLARVGTHLFFSWPGAWGERGAFARNYRGGEPAVAVPATVPGDGLAAGSEAAAVAGGQETAVPGLAGFQYVPARLPSGMEDTPLYGNRLRLVHPDGRAFGLLTASDATAAKLVNAALALCAKPGSCQVQAWSHEDDVPGAYPIPAATRDTMVFEYRRDGADGQSVIRFDCERFPTKDRTRCLRDDPKGPAVLSGVRWKSS